MHVRKGDQVVVISGNDKGKSGQVIEVLRGMNKVVVQGMNLRVKHTKPTQQKPQGERVTREFPIHSSNVMPLDPTTGKGTRKRPQKD